MKRMLEAAEVEWKTDYLLVYTRTSRKHGNPFVILPSYSSCNLEVIDIGPPECPETEANT